VSMRHADQPPVPGVAPGVVWAGQDLGAAARAIDQPRAAVATDVGEGAHLAIVSPDYDDTLAQILQAAPFARLSNLALMAHSLRCGAEECFLLCLKEFRLVIKPAGKAHPIERVCRWFHRFELRRHAPPLTADRGIVEGLPARKSLRNERVWRSLASIGAMGASRMSNVIKRRDFLIGTGAGALAGLVSAPLNAAVRGSPRAATAIYRNARIWTGVPGQPWSDAIALHGNRIVALGE